MRRVLSSLLSVACAALVVVLAAGCGLDDPRAVSWSGTMSPHSAKGWGMYYEVGVGAYGTFRADSVIRFLVLDEVNDSLWSRLDTFSAVVAIVADSGSFEFTAEAPGWYHFVLDNREGTGERYVKLATHPRY